jgi:hypothetical protein
MAVVMLSPRRRSVAVTMMVDSAETRDLEDSGRILRQPGLELLRSDLGQQQQQRHCDPGKMMELDV